MGAALRTSLGASWGFPGAFMEIGSPPRSHQEAREGNPFMKKILTYLKKFGINSNICIFFLDMRSVSGKNRKSH